MIATKPIVLLRPYVPESAIAAVSDVLRSRWIGQGPKVEEFERKFGEYVRMDSCVAVSSCTAALQLAYILAGIQDGDTVIAPLFSCTATSIPLLYQRAKIRFADVERGSLNMDAAHVARLMEEYPVKAIVTVHYGGMPAKAREFCRYGVPVIEDCAQALGANVGRDGWAACYSFQAVKHLTTCDGGMLALSDESLVAKAKRMRWFGIDRTAKLNGTWANDITEIGFKQQMTDIAAAMGIEGLKTLDWQIAHRRALRDAYASGLDGIDGIRLLDTDPESACWLCTVLVERRDDFRRKLAAESIESNQVHYRNDRYTIFKEFRGEFPNMDAIDGKYLVLPLHMGLEIEDVERVCEVVRSGW
jgi:perosamine synthetase